MTLEESIMINNIIAEILAKKGNAKINIDTLSKTLNMISKNVGLNTINSTTIDIALESIKGLEPNSSLIEKALYVITYNKSKEYKDIKEYIFDFETLRTALTSTFLNDDFCLNEGLLIINPVLYNLVSEYKEAKTAISDNKVSLNLALLLDTILEQIFILFFLHPSDYEYKYKLLSQVIRNIIDNQKAFLNGATLNSIELLLERQPENQIAKNILFAKTLLDQQYKEPIKSTKKA